MFQKIAKHRANDASNDVHRPPLYGIEAGNLSTSAPIQQLLIMLLEVFILNKVANIFSNLVDFRESEYFHLAPAHFLFFPFLLAMTTLTKSSTSFATLLGLFPFSLLPPLSPFLAKALMLLPILLLTFCAAVQPLKIQLYKDNILRY